MWVYFVQCCQSLGSNKITRNPYIFQGTFWTKIPSLQDERKQLISSEVRTKVIHLLKYGNNDVWYMRLFQDMWIHFARISKFPIRNPSRFWRSFFSFRPRDWQHNSYRQCLLLWIRWTFEGKQAIIFKTTGIVIYTAPSLRLILPALVVWSET